MFVPLDSNATIGTVERSIIGDTTAGVPLSRNTESKVRVRLDLSQLAAGDEFEMRVYSKVDAGTQRLQEVYPFVGTQGQLFESPEFWLRDGYDITLIKTAGTDRVIRWEYLSDERDDVAAIPAAVGALVIEGGETLIQTLRLITSVLLGPAAIDVDAGTYTYNSRDGLTARVVGTIVGAVRSITTRTGA